jgi:hypothetical protein
MHSHSADSRGLEECAVVFFNLAQDRSCHEAMVERKAPKLIVHLTSCTTLAVVQELCIAALCTLSTTVRHVSLHVFAADQGDAGH